jgi:hypothetical protein
MGKQRTVHGAYSRDDLGNHGGSPLKVTEMDRSRTKNFTVADGVGLANLIDCNSNEESNFGMAASIKRRQR